MKICIKCNHQSYCQNVLYVDSVVCFNSMFLCQVAIQAESKGLSFPWVWLASSVGSRMEGDSYENCLHFVNKQAYTWVTVINAL